MAFLPRRHASTFMKEIKTTEDMQFVLWLKKQCEYEMANPPMPKPVKDIAETMNKAGHKIYLVGGATRSIVDGNQRLQETIDWCDQAIAWWKETHSDWEPKEIKFPKSEEHAI